MISIRRALVCSIALIGLGLSSALAAEPNPLGVFSFDLERFGKDPAKQVEALKKIGFAGVTLNYSGGRKGVEQRFAAFKKAADAEKIEIYAAHQAYYLEKNNDGALRNADWAIGQAKQVGADFWLIVLAKGGHQISDKQLVEFVDAFAEKCKKQGVRCVLYPHDNTLIESAEEAIEILKKTKRKDLTISLHLCHEIRAGNGDRLDEVAQKVKPYLRYASISGADKKYVDGSRDWSDSIKPLDEGDFDASQFVKALQGIGYDGPVILHTFDLHKAKAGHHERSYKAFQKFYR